MSNFEKLVVNNLYHGFWLLILTLFIISFSCLIRLGFVEKDWLSYTLIIVDFVLIFYHSFNLNRVK